MLVCVHLYVDLLFVCLSHKYVACQKFGMETTLAISAGANAFTVKCEIMVVLASCWGLRSPFLVG